MKLVVLMVTKLADAMVVLKEGLKAARTAVMWAKLDWRREQHCEELLDFLLGSIDAHLK